MPPGKTAAFHFQSLLALLILALLICDTAAGLAGRLAGSMALAAAAVLGAVAQVSGLQGLNVAHNDTSHHVWI